MVAMAFLSVVNELPHEQRDEAPRGAHARRRTGNAASGIFRDLAEGGLAGGLGPGRLDLRSDPEKGGPRRPGPLAQVA